MNRAKIFVSYRKIDPDRSLVHQIVSGLRPEHDVTVDVDIPPGQRPAELIQQHLEGCDFVLAILSEAATESDIVVAEIETAHSLYKLKGRPIILVIRVNPKGPARCPLSVDLSQLQHIHWRTGNDISETVQSIRQAIQGNGSGRRRVSRSMTKEGLEAFLASLDTDRERAGEQYELIRRKLVTFFRGRGVTSAEDAADETIDRVAKKLLAGEVIHKVNAYLLGVARKVASEILKKPKDVPISDVKEPRGNPINYEKEQETRRRERCVLHSLELLNPEQRELIIEWYTYDQGEKVGNRRRLAARRECTVATLKVQAFRVREKLRRLVEECMRTLP